MIRDIPNLHYFINDVFAVNKLVGWQVDTRKSTMNQPYMHSAYNNDVKCAKCNADPQFVLSAVHDNAIDITALCTDCLLSTLRKEEKIPLLEKLSDSAINTCMAKAKQGLYTIALMPLMAKEFGSTPIVPKSTTLPRIATIFGVKV